jgi:hypothetical protein
MRNTIKYVKKKGLIFHLKFITIGSWQQLVLPGVLHPHFLYKFTCQNWTHIFLNRKVGGNFSVFFKFQVHSMREIGRRGHQSAQAEIVLKI